MVEQHKGSSIESLRILFQGSVVQESPLEARFTTIGREPDTTLHLDHASVSRRHAQICRVYNEFYVEDLGSTNGTLLNGRRVTKHVLRAGDTVAIGAYELELMARPVAKDKAEVDLDRTMVLSASTAPAPQPKTAGTTPLQATVSVRALDGEQAGTELPMKRTLLTLGLPGVGLAVIAKRADGYYLLHVGGEQFPQVNDESVGRSGVHLRAGDTIRVANVRYEFLLADGGSASRPV